MNSLYPFKRYYLVGYHVTVSSKAWRYSQSWVSVESFHSFSPTDVREWVVENTKDIDNAFDVTILCVHKISKSSYNEFEKDRIKP